MKQLPNWITFTGVDSYTDLARLCDLSDEYKGRVEWGVLFSENQQAKGNHRYPPNIIIDNLRVLNLDLSAHLCGKYATIVNKGEELPIDLGCFGRVQINHRTPDINTLNDFSNNEKFTVIAQSRDDEGFPMGGNVQWLFDQSGGRGERATKLPKNIGSVMCGYAGGIDPENVLEVIGNIDAESYWIDMESGVRNKNDLFDLDKCEAVLKAVYG